MQSADSQFFDVAGYHLTELIGSGGMGNVYKGYQDTLNRTVAVKVLHQKEFAERFKNEAYIQSSVSHPNIAKLYEYYLNTDTPCIIMEYVEGECLDALLKRKRKLSSTETENIIRQIAQALAYLHKKHIIHRDIKPQNFKVQPDGTVKMLDFGIAKHKYSPKFTQLGFVVGTPEYIAPEQFREKAELKSDTWALTVMTYELITGYLPFEANNPVTLRSKITTGSFTNPKLLIPDISDSLLTMIEKGLRVNPSSRISAQEIANLFEPKLTPRLLDKPRITIWQKPFFIAAMVLTVIIFFLLARKADPAQKTDVSLTGDKIANEKVVMINVSGIQNAEIVFGDSLRKILPYPVRGKEGEKVEFTIRADGYKDKKVELEITSRRSAYEFDLEKNP